MPSPGDRGASGGSSLRLVRRRSSIARAVALVLIALSAVLLAADAPEAARASADVVLVREGEVVEEDLYAGGNVVTIAGTIEGDLVVWAFDRLDIRGEVEGDVVGFAAEASITGKVGGSVRLVGRNVTAAGEVGADVFAIGWNVRTGGSVGRDVLAWARSLVIEGSVGRDVEGQTWGGTTISGAVGRDVEMTVQSMRLTDGAFIAEDLGYRSSRDAEIASEARVGGAVIRRSPVAPNVSVSAARFVALVLGFMAYVWLGILVIWLLPSTLERAVRSVRNDLSRTFFVGLAAIVTPLILLFSIFLISALAPPELGFTLLAVGSPFWLGAIVILMLSALVAPLPVLIVLGRRLSRDRLSAFAAFVMLSIPLAIVLFVPYVRVLVLGPMIVIGIGALARGALQSRGSVRWIAGTLAENDRRVADPPPAESPPDDDPPALYAVESDDDEP